MGRIKDKAPSISMWTYPRCSGFLDDKGLRVLGLGFFRGLGFRGLGFRGLGV